jgi:hypothetical protein
LSFTRAVLAAVAAAAMLVGGAAPALAADQPPQPRTRLTVIVQAAPTEPASFHTLSCVPAQGTYRDPAATCAALDQVTAATLAPVPADATCTKIYGGPQRAVVAGLWRGRPVLATFDRSDGCEIARWDAMATLLGTVD